MYIIEASCPVCKVITWHENGECEKCVQRSELERIAKWNAMSIDDRLNDLRKQIEYLNQKGRRLR